MTLKIKWAKKLIYLIVFLPCIAFGARVKGGTEITSDSSFFIHNSSLSQVGQFNVSSGTIRGKLMFDTDGDTYFLLTGDDLELYVHGDLRQTWTTIQPEDCLLLNDGTSFRLLDDGVSKIIINP
jgi:hypothetical protein